MTHRTLAIGVVIALALGSFGAAGAVDVPYTGIGDPDGLTANQRGGPDISLATELALAAEVAALMVPDEYVPDLEYVPYTGLGDPEGLISPRA